MSFIKEEKQHFKQEATDRFTELMFGRKLQTTDKVDRSGPNMEEWVQLIAQAQEIGTTINKLKPLIQQLSPLLDFLQNKTK